MARKDELVERVLDAVDTYREGDDPKDPVDPKDPPPTLKGEDEIDARRIVFLHRNIQYWDRTSQIIKVDIRPVDKGPVCIYHTKAGVWPVYGGQVKVEGNPWVFAFIRGQWFGATYEHNRPGQVCKPDVNRLTIGPLTKASPMSEWIPSKGEWVGFAVAASSRYDRVTVTERSNIVLVKWPT